MKRFGVILILCIVTGCWILVHGASSINIPLYHEYSETSIADCYTRTEDAPGSSTVDPVDPNLARADLINNTLVVREEAEGNAYLVLLNDKEAMGEPVFNGSFDEMVCIPLLDTASYYISLRFENGYTLYGTFRYPVLHGEKIWVKGQLIIITDKNKYALSGKKIE